MNSYEFTQDVLRKYDSYESLSIGKLNNIASSCVDQLFVWYNREALTYKANVTGMKNVKYWPMLFDERLVLYTTDQIATSTGTRSSNLISCI